MSDLGLYTSFLHTPEEHPELLPLVEDLPGPYWLGYTQWNLFDSGIEVRRENSDGIPSWDAYNVSSNYQKVSFP